MATDENLKIVLIILYVKTSDYLKQHRSDMSDIAKMQNCRLKVKILKVTD